jgi:hypothetical protein
VREVGCAPFACLIRVAYSPGAFCLGPSSNRACGLPGGDASPGGRAMSSSGSPRLGPCIMTGNFPPDSIPVSLSPVTAFRNNAPREPMHYVGRFAQLSSRIEIAHAVGVVSRITGKVSRCG